MLLIAVTPDAISGGIACALAVDAGEALLGNRLAVRLPLVTIKGLARLGYTTAGSRVV